MNETTAKSIAFIDTEVDPATGRIFDFGGLYANGPSFHSASRDDFLRFLASAEFVCGHNILDHDLKYIRKSLASGQTFDYAPIDTLYLSPLLFPRKPYHALLKDDKLLTASFNNPLNDSMKAKDLFFDEWNVFKKLDEAMKAIFYLLLKDRMEFRGFFQFIDYQHHDGSVESMIREHFYGRICNNIDLSPFVSNHPVELAYALALISADDRYSITPPWVLVNFPAVENILFLLRNKPCLTGCSYCHQSLDIRKGLRDFFGFDAYRTFGGEPIQERAVQAAVDNKSLLAVFQTGGGKSIAFQVPALMSGVNAKGLTVVISPLQSLMKDQVDNLEKAGISEAVTINGLLDPIERADAFERVENGSASILYISPESLRSRSIERLLLGRNVVRFVIDEAHCFSSWGQDFRVDYLYIGDFIKSLQEMKNLPEGIPVSCFTATAKQKVIEDIREYFRSKLSIELELFASKASRTNLHYNVMLREDDQQKYTAMRALIEEKGCPTIVYVSRTRRTEEIAGRLTRDGFQTLAYHGKMERQERTSNQERFLNGEIQVMVATSAFGMGVDKKDVGMVIHYDISDSLENYIQEAGRAGRDEAITADCYILYNEDDLNKHFLLLNQTKLSLQEIQQVWKAIKDLTRFRSTVSQSALEIARKAGWDDSVKEIETRVRTAVSALEESGYLKRGQNMPRVYADSILVKSHMEAIEKIEGSGRFSEKEKIDARRIIQSLISSKYSKRTGGDIGESRIDYLSDILAIAKEDVIRAVNLLKEEQILADTKDLKALIKKKNNLNRLKSQLDGFLKIENKLLEYYDQEETVIHIKEINEEMEKAGIKDITPAKINTILNFWSNKGWIKKKMKGQGKSHVALLYAEREEDLRERIQKRHQLAGFIIEYLLEAYENTGKKEEDNTEEIIIDFSLIEIKEAYEGVITFFSRETNLDEIQEALLYLSKIEAIQIEGGFMVLYNALTIERLELDNKRKFKQEDYQKLNEFYSGRIQQIHIVGEYAKRMVSNYRDALQFVDDYFQLNYASFLNKYFPGSRQDEIKKNITPKKFRQLFGELSTAQLNIINDRDSQAIVVAAGPGSGKTRILVHKLASLMLMEDIKHEQLLMLTFSRSAATEFKKRLIQLIGNAAYFVEIKTFHSYCFDIMGRMGKLEGSEQIISQASERIRRGEAEEIRVAKSVLVIDEAQDMDEQEYGLVTALMERNEGMRVIAVGDDDQNIFEFRGSSSMYMGQLIQNQGAVLYELLENYRSTPSIVDFSNQAARKIPNRLKRTPIQSVRKEAGGIRLFRYRSDNLIAPLVQQVLSDSIQGSSCILTKTNEEAMQVAGLLLRGGLPVKLIQSNDGFNLYHLQEVRSFIEYLELDDDSVQIDQENWDAARRKFVQEYSGSLNLEVCTNLVKDFEATNTNRIYLSDFLRFIQESKQEDFYGGSVETVFVSTIHKAKGREFDNVYMMLDRFPINNDESWRQLYVGLTRAKTNLSLFINNPWFDQIRTNGLEVIRDVQRYQPPYQIAMLLTYKDVYLDYFNACQDRISYLKSGDELIFDKKGCYDLKGNMVLRYSKHFSDQLEDLMRKGYGFSSARVRYVLYWKKDEEEKEIRVVLPEVVLSKQ